MRTTKTLSQIIDEWIELLDALPATKSDHRRKINLWLRWLSYGLSFGTDSPLVLNLSVFGLTLGAWLKITIADIIFIVLSLLIGRLLMRRR